MRQLLKKYLSTFIFVAGVSAWGCGTVAAEVAPAPRSAIESVGRALTSAITPASNALFGVGMEGVKGLTGNMTDNMTAISNRQNAQLMYLAPHNLKFTDKANCTEFVDLINATGMVGYPNPPSKTKAVEASIYKGYLAGCVAPKTELEKLDPSLRQLYDTKRRLILSTPTCVGYSQRADKLVGTNITVAEKRLELANTFAAARSARCMQE